MTSVLTYALVFIVVFSLFVFIVLFGPAPRFRDTPIGLANRVLTNDLPRVLNRVDGAVTGGWTGKVCGYVFSAATPLIMIIYLFLMTGGIYIFFQATWKHIPGPAVSWIHWWIVPLVLPTPYLSLFFLSRSDPGIITPQNHENHVKLFPYDQLLFTPNIYCRTCKLAKPARSKHCNVCNVCVARQDHHCIWIGNCVGYSNTHLFLGFLLINTLLLAYSSYLHYLIFSHQVAQIRLVQKHTMASFGAALHSVRLRSTYQLYSSVILEAELGGALFLICSMISIVTTGFMAHHSWLLSTGTTTNESFKWADIKEALEAKEVVILDSTDPFMVNRTSRIVPLDPPAQDEEVETLAEEACRVGLAGDITRGARTWKNIKNIYASDSRWENFVDGVKGGFVKPRWQQRQMKQKE